MRSEDSGQPDYQAEETAAVAVGVLVDAAAGYGELQSVREADDKCSDGLQEGAPDYFILRASATYQIDKSWSVWVRGENLTDRNYQPALGFYGPSIACYGGVKFSF